MSSEMEAGGSSPRLVLYAYDSCPYCQRVFRAVAALGIRDRIEVRNTLEDPAAQSELRKATGRTQVPCLFIDGEPLFESLDIMEWLEDNVERLR